MPVELNRYIILLSEALVEARMLATHVAALVVGTDLCTITADRKL